MRLNLKIALGLLAAAVGIYALWTAIQVHRNLVTLNVRNMEVRKVVKKIEWQTWETILVHTNVQGTVTLNVRKMPLDQVLRMVGEQASARSSVIYPLYSSAKSLQWLKRGLRGEVDPTQYGWTNLQSPGGFRGGPRMGPGGGPFGAPQAQSSQNQLVSFQIINKDVEFARQVFDRFAQVQIVPEDGTKGMIKLILNKAPVSKAVGELAKKAHRNWTKLYVLRGGFGPGGRGGFGGPPPQFAAREPNQAGPGRDRNGPPQMTTEQREEFRAQRQAAEQEFMQGLPAAERQRLEQAQQEREKQFQEMQNLTPEQRRERFAKMGPGAGFDRMNRERIRNSTPEQRLQMQRRMMQRPRMDQQPQQPPPNPRPAAG